MAKQQTQNSNINQQASSQKDILKKKSISTKRENVATLTLTNGKEVKISIENGVITKKDIYPYHDKLKEVVIPDGVTKISKLTFENCRSLTKVVIPDSVTEIDWGAFRECKALKDVVISENVTKIGDGAFAQCTELTNIVIPKSVTQIGVCAFYDCKKLSSVVIPESVKEIGWGAFSYCRDLKEIWLPEGSELEVNISREAHKIRYYKKAKFKK